MQYLGNQKNKYLYFNFDYYYCRSLYGKWVCCLSRKEAQASGGCMSSWTSKNKVKREIS